MEKQKEYDNKDVGIMRMGEQIILPCVPVPMHEQTAIDYLQRKLKHDEMEVGFYEMIDCHPIEGAWALKKVLEKKYGWAESQGKTVQGLFGSRTIKPSIVSVEVDYEKHEQVILGQFVIPGSECVLETASDWQNGQPMFVIASTVKKKFEGLVKEIADLVREFVKTNSLYRGKPLRLKANDAGEINLSQPPSFLDLSRVNESELIFADDLESQVQTNLFTPIEKTEMCRQHKIPLKRGVLLEGRYGTGKTLAAYVAAKKARANGWTFIYLDRVSGLDQAIEFAKRYEPCVIFAEDIDRAMSGDRDVEIDDILNTIDGIGSKNREVMVILTTNDVNSIEKAMLRPGRLDAVISFSPPDSLAAQKLIRLYARGLIKEGEDLTEAGLELSGQIPAVIREVVERSKLYAISRSDGKEFTLSGRDIAASARGMKRHLSLLENKPEEKTLEHRVGETLGELMHVKGGLNGHGQMVEEIHERIVQ